jgi:replicative DNA helicase
LATGFDVEGGLLACIVRDADLTPALEARVTTEWFQDQDHREVWDLLTEHYREYGEVLTERLLRHDRPDYRLSEVTESMSVYLDRAVDRRRSNLLRMALTEAVIELEDGDSSEAADILARGLTRVYSESSSLRDVDLIETWKARVAKYDEFAANRGKMLGIPMGIKTIDDALFGFQREQLITFVGRQKAGKSYLLMYAAINAHRYGATPLFVSFEMSNDEQAARHDALIAKVDHSALVRGDSTESMRKKVEKALGRRKNMHPFILSSDSSGANTVSALSAKIEQYHPDILFVDGVYLMEDEMGGRDDREKLTNITRSLKRLAQRTRIPVVMSTQALEWKIGRKGLTTSSIGYTSSFGQDSDALIGVESVDEEEDPGLKRLKILDARNAPRLSTLIQWDFANGTVTELEDEEQAAWDDLEKEMN